MCEELGGKGVADVVIYGQFQHNMQELKQVTLPHTQA
jgi:hypothetical protein